jgi:hypothetical protein
MNNLRSSLDEAVAELFGRACNAWLQRSPGVVVHMVASIQLILGPVRHIFGPE